MPTYSYRCKACGNEFDIQQSFSDDALTVCNECGGELRKLFNSVGIVFKGSGFYRNDARSSSSGLTASSDSSSDKNTEKSAAKSTSTESKSAEKASPAESTSAPAAAASN